MEEKAPQTNAWDNPAFAAAWNATYGMDMAGAPMRAGLIYPLLEKRIGDFNGLSLVDFGCGNGNLIGRFAGQPFKKWAGYDGGRAILSSARKHLRDKRVTFRQLDLTASGLSFQRADVLTSVFVLEEIPATRLIDFFRNAAAALKPDGRAYFFTNHPAYAMQEAKMAERLDVPNVKFNEHKGYFDTAPAAYNLSQMGQSLPYHHKPISLICNAMAASGLRLTEMQEIPGGISTMAAWRAHTPAMNDTPRFLFVAATPV